MSNSPQNKRPRWQEPWFKKPWQRFLFTFVLGLITGLIIQWTLTGYDAERVAYSRHWRNSLPKYMLEIAPPETWFWIIFVFFLILAVWNEFYHHHMGKKIQRNSTNL